MEVGEEDKKQIGEYTPFFLSATDEAEIDKDVSNVFDQVIASDKAYNIAITGPYSSGKSSFVSSYKKKNSEFAETSIDVSLASFQVDEIEGNETSNKSEAFNFADIEKSIIQQIIYKVPSSTIPKSRFSKLANSKDTTKWRSYIFSSLWLLSVFYIFNPKSYIFIDPVRPIIGKNLEFFNIGLSLLMLTGCLLGVAFIFKHLKNNLPLSKISYLNPTNAEVSFFSESDSVLNRTLDELVYFFSSSKYNKIIFEDLERLNKPEIFTKLREINIILNNSFAVREKHKDGVKFIYVTKDDCFSATERTKFFDFILPIIPIIHSNNSYEKLLELISSIRNENLSRSYLRDVTVFISDMRVLQNIVNEFYFYRKLVNHDQSLSDDNLFSLVLCKNMFPVEFELLQKNRGKIFSAFDTSKVKREMILESKLTVEECEEEIKKIKNAIKLSENEYKTLIRWKIDTILSQFQSVSNWRLGQDIISVRDYENIYLGLRKGHELKLTSYGSIESLAENGEYLEIQRYIEKLELLDEPDEQIDLLNRKITEKLRTINRIEDASLKDMCSLFESRRENLTGYKSDHIIHYLLRKGYIYEDYQKYISIFYEGELTRNDFTFKNNIVYGKKPNFEYQLSRPADIVKLLDDNSFSQTSVLNFNLFEYLISKKHQLLKKTPIIFDINPKILIEFIDKLESSCDIDISPVLEILVSSRANFLELSKSYTDKFGEWCYKLCMSKDFSSVDFDNYLFLTNYLNENVKIVIEIASKEKEIRERVLDNIISLEPLLELVEFDHENYEQCEVYILLFKTGCIRINPISLYSYFKCSYKSEVFSLDFILKSKDELLIENTYDIDLFQQLVEKYWIETTKKGDESEDSIVHMLKSEIGIEIKHELISNLNAPLSRIRDASFDYATNIELSRQDKVIPSIENLVAFFDSFDVVKDDELFKEYNSEVDRVISANKESILTEIKGLDIDSTLSSFTGIILFDVVQMATFKQLIQPLSKYIPDYDLDKLTNQKYEYLIKEKLVIYSDELKSEFEEGRTALLPLLISCNKDKFAETNYFDDLLDETLCSIAKLEILSNAEVLTIFESLSERRFFDSDELASCFADLLIIQPSEQVSEDLFGYLVEHIVEPRSDKGQLLIRSMHDKFDPIYLIEYMPFDCIPFFSLKDRICIFESGEVSDKNKLLAIASLSDEEFQSPAIDTIYLSTLACEMKFDGVKEVNIIKLASELNTDFDLIKLLTYQMDLLSKDGVKDICGFSTEQIAKINTAKTHFELPDSEEYDLFSSLMLDKKLIKRKQITKSGKIRVYLAQI
ncbi:hypothetical protein CWC26_10105 [Pseudoalteromonas sp. S4488]|uniref:YobI family P-loop NTPase n=1 Tax=unclassified Pseudoalteromonas TaxID=194690 RepID=UPI0010238410|nr:MULTISPECIES: hypothetical protein [unclassified Pseudoalteromonas]RZF85424.1 hypothetical protein EXT43_05950 [Pseudoalteromonas sp. CO109Y]TMO38668.1 hypothetical protein CWC26_10105 [Pseudoalteromonas sp. S4488]TMO39394.1 hypothetical protein CWC27_01555 [Pseudoalteromonas sp. S4491]